MDTAILNVLVRKFVQMVDLPKLQADYPEQFQKHWENQGQSGTVHICRCQIIDQPCEVTFSFFFSGEEVIQTGIHIRFRDEVLLNEVRKGDTLNYRATRRVDPVSFLKAEYGTRKDALDAPADTESFALVTDDDSEPEVFRAVQQLTGYTQDELREIWQGLLDTNDQRPGLDRVGPIIKTWLKKVRDRLDMQYLRDAEVLQPRMSEVNHFTGHGRAYTVVTRRMRGSAIRQMVDSSEPAWWGGGFYTLRGDELVRMPREQKDRVLFLKSFDPSLDCPVEDIFVDNRHIYSVVFVGEEALVWRTRDQVTAEKMGVPLAPMAGAGGARPARGLGKLVSKLTRKPAEEPLGTEIVEPQEEAREAAVTETFVLGRAEKAYMEALRAKAADLGDRRIEYIKLLYKSDPWRFGGRPEELSLEMQSAAGRAVGQDAARMAREKPLIEAHITIFYSEVQPAS